MFKPGRSILVVFGCLVKIPLFEIHIISNLWLTRLRKVFKSLIFVEWKKCPNKK